jgi:hypothetical protein
MTDGPLSIDPTYYKRSPDRWAIDVMAPGRKVTFIPCRACWIAAPGVVKKEDPWGGWIIVDGEGREHWVTRFDQIIDIGGWSE